MSLWKFSVGNHQLAAPEWLLQALSPSMTFYLTGQPHEFTCTIDANSTAGLNVQELVQDVWAWRDGELPFRGPLISASDTIDASSHTVALTAHSYRERLAHWPIPLAPSGSGMTPLGSGIASLPAWGWRAINLTLPSSDLANIVIDSHVTAGLASNSQSAQGGTATDAAIDTLATISPFDWDMVPSTDGKIHYTTWTPRGTARPDAVAIYSPGKSGSNILNVSRTLDLSTFGNKVWMTGQDKNSATLAATASTPFGPEGLWGIADSASNVDSTASGLAAQAANQLVLSETPQAAYTLTMAPGWWQGPDQVWLGDSIQLVIKSGRLNIAEMVRVTQIQITPTDDGSESVQITVGAQPNGKSGEYALVRTFRNIQKRLRNLEWKQ